MQKMAPPGIEVIIGESKDLDFGPELNPILAYPDGAIVVGACVAVEAGQLM